MKSDVFEEAMAEEALRFGTYDSGALGALSRLRPPAAGRALSPGAARFQGWRPTRSPRTAMGPRRRRARWWSGRACRTARRPAPRWPWRRRTARWARTGRGVYHNTRHQTHSMSDAGGEGRPRPII